MQVKLNDVRIAFTNNLWVPGQFQGTGPFAYKSTFLFAPTHPCSAELQAAIRKVAGDAWGAKADQILATLKDSPQKFCIGKGDTKDYDGFAGMLYIGASRKKEDGLPYLADTRNNQLFENTGIIYAGCYVNAMVDIWCQDNNFGKGVRATLMGVQKLRDGDAFAGGKVASSTDFAPVEGFDNEHAAEADSGNSLF